jgi:hypothetical protein
MDSRFRFSVTRASMTGSTIAGIPHDVVPDTLGMVVVFHDPDGLEIHLYSQERHGLDMSGKAGYGRPVTQPPANWPD